MSVSIDTVYQRVLSILNKEQRGYLTPQEFNLFANQAQMDIFEQYFYDLNQFLRLPKNSSEYSDMLDILNEKISLFETSASSTGSLPSDLYRIGAIVLNGVEAQYVLKNNFLTIINSPLVKPTTTRPIYIKDNTGIKVYTSATDLASSFTIQYIKRPAQAVWGYIEVNDVALYNEDTATDFELHDSEETDLVMKVLAMAGLSIREPDIYAAASQEDLKNVQQEKA